MAALQWERVRDNWLRAGDYVIERWAGRTSPTRDWRPCYTLFRIHRDEWGRESREVLETLCQSADEAKAAAEKHRQEQSEGVT